ncbi:MULTISPECIES: hypothetical protein [Prochlorococcus]|uniref:hypothetical protein n=1 Tax=Prochlorococcus TaxID=1218 RepID=UPI0007B3749E|nr:MULTISPECIES: hypothetical protein [Prochlorococcus]KZR65322.1 hypothetical protein PMIT1312_01213 [Prochlorococcus marinus str. MIT 1312]KZR79177.1 hypothetical protein PMIT1327_02384 [Prochlorococcus marinus str. MIT 1327]NMO83448.1 hypothetical protein [Prochlorococcus sp. P1344]NMP06958.1 hypothetical protein [Prochlorococcus sp. P1361]NMP12669.1 hypothetical protein [Prochlorococcus sp.P1363]
MSLVPRWEVMTDEAKAITKRIAVSALLVLLALWLVRALIPWVIVAICGYWAYRWLAKST